MTNWKSIKIRATEIFEEYFERKMNDFYNRENSEKSRFFLSRHNVMNVNSIRIPSEISSGG